MTVSTQASATARRWRKQYRPIAANTNNSRQTSRPADLAAQQRSYQVLCDRAAGPPPRISTADTTSADAALLIGDRMRTHRVSISFGQVAVAVMLATSVACGSDPSGTRATNAEPMRSADSASAGPSASASSQLGYPSPATPSVDISSSAGPSESPTSPRVLPSSASGKDLSLTDIFASKGEWNKPA